MGRKRVESTYQTDEGGVGYSPGGYGWTPMRYWESDWQSHRIVELVLGKPLDVRLERRSGTWYAFGRETPHTFCDYVVEYRDIILKWNKTCRLREFAFYSIVVKGHLFKNGKPRRRTWEVRPPSDEMKVRHLHIGYDGGTVGDIFILRGHKKLYELLQRLADFPCCPFNDECLWEKDEGREVLAALKSLAPTKKEESNG